MGDFVHIPASEPNIVKRTSSNKVSIVSTALRLRKMTIARVCPLVGGFDRWKQLAIRSKKQRTGLAGVRMLEKNQTSEPQNTTLL